MNAGDRPYKLHYYAEVLRQTHGYFSIWSVEAPQHEVTNIAAALMEAAEELDAWAAELLGSLL